MSQVVQARCPHCQNVLRIPEEWLVLPMRCKHCKATFQAKGKSSTPTKPTAAISANPPDTPRPASAAPFVGFEEDGPISSIRAKSKKQNGNGLLVLVGIFFFLFVLGAAGATFVVYKAMTLSQIAKGDGPANPPKNKDRTNADSPKDRNGNTDKAVEPPPPTDAATKDQDKKKPNLPPNKDTSKKDFVNKDAKKKPPTFTNDPFPRRASAYQRQSST